MKRLLLALCMVFVVGELSAALPPFAQSKREIEAILTSQELYQYIPSSDVLQQIVKTPTGYLIITTTRIVPVSVRYLSNRNLGPARFSVKFYKPIETGMNQPGSQDQESCSPRNDYQKY